jgi:dTDP-4-amino-4,6-dideoxygalactose transaminase
MSAPDGHAPIPLVDVKANYLRHRDAIDAAMREVIESTQFIQGKALADFEAAYAGYCGARYAIGVGSGTAAIHLILAAIGVGPGDRVAIPSHTFIASAEPITWLGAEPVFVEIDPATGGMDPAALATKIDGVKAVMPVHIHGRTVDLDAITGVAEAAGVPVIEDAAQSHGATYRRADGTVVRAGAYGLAGAFSFYPGKNLGAYGDAGAVTTNDEDLAGKVRMLRDHGRISKYEHLIVGYAHRMDTLQGAVLLPKLASLDGDNARRQELAAAYTSALRGVGDLVLLDDPADRGSVYHHYVVRTEHREALLKHLKAHGVNAGVHYPLPLHLQPAYADLGGERGDLPLTEAYADTCLSLPIYAELTDEQLARVVAEVEAYFAQAA